jgi:NitT/TauT family transport system substrate-binding protein
MKKGICLCIGAMAFMLCSRQQPPVTLKVGHVGHDHQTALYVACLEGARFQKEYGLYLKEVRPKEFYELYDGNRKICDVELYKSGGGSKMPTLMSQGHFELGLGGVAAVVFFVDKEAPMKIIAPLHSKGDMLVVNPAVNAHSWPEFVKWVQENPRQIRVGYKDPVAVAKLIFTKALQETGLSYTEDPANRKADIILINMKGEENLIPGLQNKIIEAYISNNPWCALAEKKGAGRIVCPLNELPPGIWKDHPCCCIAASDQAIKDKGKAITKFLELMAIATRYINEEPEMGYNAASQWIGTPLEVEKISMPTSGYSVEPTDAWKEQVQQWCRVMDEGGEFKGALKSQTPAKIDSLVFNLTLIEQALKDLQKRKK